MSNDTATISKEEHDAALAEIEFLKERVDKLQHLLWGRRSEQQPPSPDAPFQSDLFAEGEVALQDDPQEEEQAEDERLVRQPRKARKPRFADHVERKIIDIEIPESERKCSCCGEELSSIGFESAERAHYVPAKIVIHEERRHKYACKCKEGGVTTTPTLPTLFPKSRVTDEMRAHVIVNKFVDHAPYYRQAAILRRYGYEISDSTLCRLGIEAADRLSPLIIAMHEELLASPVLQADETTLPVLKTEKAKPGAHRGWLWAYAIPRGTIVYDYTRTRAANHPSGFLASYEGILQVDRYEGYSRVLRREGVIDVACWAHARRRFVEAQQTNGRKIRPIIEAIQKLYLVERKAREDALPPDARSRIRKSASKPILDELKAYLNELVAEVRPSSGLGDAVIYTLKHWAALTSYVEHGEVEIDNNLIENSMRPVALGRKNYLFAGSELGAEAAAVLYSLTETCRRLKINPHTYLVDAMRKLAEADATDAEAIRALTPSRWLAARQSTQE